MTTDALSGAIENSKLRAETREERQPRVWGTARGLDEDRRSKKDATMVCVVRRRREEDRRVEDRRVEKGRRGGARRDRGGQKRDVR